MVFSHVFMRKLTDVDGADGDHGTVGLVEEAMRLLQVVRVGDDLVADEDVLFDGGVQPRFSFKRPLLMRGWVRASKRKGFLVPCR